MIQRVRRSLLAAALMVAVSGAAAQQPAAPALPAAAAADVQSVDAILGALYDVISGDSGVARNWDRFRSLFAPGARLIPVGRRQAGAFGASALTPEDYITRAGPALQRGFHEREVARRTETFGRLLHAFSTYESRRRQADAVPFQRGINSIQLYHDGTRWWVMSVMWWAESPESPLPGRYLMSEAH